jgi:broad specificity phosphatase PhoE
VNTWIFLRHGESEANQARVFSGHQDVSLTALGRQQATTAGTTLRELLGDQPLRFAWSSDLRRAMETGERCLEAAGINLPLQIHRDLRERHLGDWQGKDIDQLKAEGARKVLTSWNGAAPGGESLAQISKRAVQLLETLPEAGPVLLVGHGGLIRALVGLVDGTPLEEIGRMNILNAVPISRTIRGGQWGEIARRIAG